MSKKLNLFKLNIRYKKKILLIWVLLATISCTECFAQKKNQVSYNFKHGVSIAHWVDYLFKGRTYGDPKWFAQSDVQWIAKQGLDHIMIRVSGKEISSEKGLNNEQMAILDSAIVWAEKENIGVVLHLQEFPSFKIDSTINALQRDELLLVQQLKFWNSFAKYFSHYNNNVRFNIELPARRLSKTVANINRYNSAVIKEIRKYNFDTKVYLASIVADSITQLVIPDDKYIIMNLDYDAIPIFTNQVWVGFPHSDLPIIKFPGKIPDLSNIQFSKDDDWFKEAASSQKEISQKDIETVLKKYANWRDENFPHLELYVPSWGYATGWPYNPKYSEDKNSISNFAKSFSKICKKYNVRWAIYDYNSGMAIRVNNQPSVLLNSLKL